MVLIKYNENKKDKAAGLILAADTFTVSSADLLLLRCRVLN